MSMCGRYNVTDDPAVHALLDFLNVDLGPLPVRYNLAPTDSVPVIHYWEGERVISDMRWWLVPHWSSGPSTQYSMFNARSERLSGSRAFQGPFRHKRAVLPAASFVEWHRHQGEKTPYLFEAPDQALAFAGLWDYWTDGTEHVLSCAIVTTEASPEFAPYHHRMPVLLDGDRAETWLNHKAPEQTLKSLFEPVMPHALEATPIDRRYNNSRDKGEPIRLEQPIRLKR